MKKLTLIFGLTLLAAFNCYAAISVTYVQGCVNSATATVTCAMGSNITSGNLLVVVGKTSNTTTATASTVAVTSSSGVSCTWVQALAGTLWVNTSAGDHATSAVYTCRIPSTGAETVQEVWSGNLNSSPFSDISVTEYNVTGGTWTSPVLDISKTTASGTSSTSCASGTSTSTSNANDKIVGVCDGWNTGQTWGAVTGYTNRVNSSRNTLGYYDKTVAATGTQSFAATITTDYNLGILVALKITPSATTITSQVGAFLPGP